MNIKLLYMKSSVLLKPINRLNYIIGVIVLFFLTEIFGFPVMSGLGDVSYIKTSLFISSLFFWLIKIIWDYKRIIDISTKKICLFILLIPIMPKIVAIILGRGDVTNIRTVFIRYNDKFSYFLPMMGIIFLLNFIYYFFLFFVKGNKKLV